MSSLPSHKGPVRVAIVGTGGMARHHAIAFKAIAGCRIVACADVDAARAQAFAKEHGIPAAFADFGELLARVDCDAVSIVTPDPFHAPLTLQALKAGKHVMCEKPLALNHRDAQRMLTAAVKAKRIHMVNLSYRNWPALQAVARFVQGGGIGEIRHVEASYLQSWLVGNYWGDWRTSPAWLWRLSKKHGSQGVLGDIGVHIVDFAMFPAGPIREVYCRLKAFPKAPGNRIGEYRLDANDSAVLNVEFANGALGALHTTRWSTGHRNRLYLKISGTAGAVEIDSERATDSYRVSRGADVHATTWKEVACKPTPNNHQRFIKAIKTGVQDQPDFGAGVLAQKVLDASFASDAKRAPVRV
jgi:predicted dehydrogenase